MSTCLCSRPAAGTSSDSQAPRCFPARRRPTRPIAAAAPTTRSSQISFLFSDPSQNRNHFFACYGAFSDSHSDEIEAFRAGLLQLLLHGRCFLGRQQLVFV